MSWRNKTTTTGYSRVNTGCRGTVHKKTPSPGLEGEGGEGSSTRRYHSSWSQKACLACQLHPSALLPLDQHFRHSFAGFLPPEIILYTLWWVFLSIELQIIWKVYSLWIGSQCLKSYLWCVVFMFFGIDFPNCHLLRSVLSTKKAAGYRTALTNTSTWIRRGEWLKK